MIASVWDTGPRADDVRSIANGKRSGIDALAIVGVFLLVRGIAQLVAA